MKSSVPTLAPLLRSDLQGGSTVMRVDELQLDRQPFEEQIALDAAVDAASMVALGVSGVRLLRLGEVAVFDLGEGTLGRVFRGGTDPRRVQRSVAVSHWFKGQGIPAVEAVDVDQPVEVDGLLVTFWASLGDADRYGSTGDLADLLRRLHALPPPTSIDLPQLDPFTRVGRRLAAADLSAEWRSFLEERCVDLKRRYENLEFVLPVGVIHEDASVGNVLIDQQGTPRLIDLDGVCVGPREWDLVLTALYYDRYGWHTRTEYETFCEVYGYDVMQWAGYETLADIREFLMVTWVAQNRHQDDRIEAELTKRLTALRTGASRRDWEPF